MAVVKEQIKNYGALMFESQRQKVVDKIEGMCRSLEEASNKMRDGDNAKLAEYTDSIVQQGDRVCDYVRNLDIDRLSMDARMFARRRPEIMLGGLALTGFALARFMRASSPNLIDENEEFKSKRRSSRQKDRNETGTSIPVANSDSPSERIEVH